jgi:hypothetical protein
MTLHRFIAFGDRGKELFRSPPFGDDRLGREFLPPEKLNDGTIKAALMITYDPEDNIDWVMSHIEFTIRNGQRFCYMPHGVEIVGPCPYVEDAPLAI